VESWPPWALPTADQVRFGAGRYRLRVIAQSGAESTPELPVRFRIT
jgi:hypothetical protein